MGTETVLKAGRASTSRGPDGQHCVLLLQRGGQSFRVSEAPAISEKETESGADWNEYKKRGSIRPRELRKRDGRRLLRRRDQGRTATARNSRCVRKMSKGECSLPENDGRRTHGRSRNCDNKLGRKGKDAGPGEQPREKKKIRSLSAAEKKGRMGRRPRISSIIAWPG